MYNSNMLKLISNIISLQNFKHNKYNFWKKNIYITCIATWLLRSIVESCHQLCQLILAISFFRSLLITHQTKPHPQSLSSHSCIALIIELITVAKWKALSSLSSALQQHNTLSKILTLHFTNTHPPFIHLSSPSNK